MLVAHATRDFAKHLRRRLSLPESLLWRALKAGKLDGLKFRKQHPIGPYVLDFYCHQALLCVEIDGGSHGFGRRAMADERRDRWLLDHRIRTLRISAALVLNDINDAVRTIRGFIEEDHPPERKPPPSASLTPPPSGRN